MFEKDLVLLQEVRWNTCNNSFGPSDTITSHIKHKIRLPVSKHK